jgi:hypothetical protein
MGEGGGGGLHSGCLCCPLPSPNAPSIAGPSGSDGDWVEVSAGDDHTCGIKNGGALFCWGGFSFLLGWGYGCLCVCTHMCVGGVGRSKYSSLCTSQPSLPSYRCSP